MHAAVVHSFDRPPHYEEFPTPEPSPDQLLVEVVAAGLHPRVRSGANNSHYTSDGQLPMVPGTDAVGRRADGRLIYFVADDTNVGTMAQFAAVEPRRSVELPLGLDPTIVAAAMNPAMSSWVALRRRVIFNPGQRVLVLGATGNAGRMAVQVAKLLGASEVIAAARDSEQLERLLEFGADTCVALTGSPEEIADCYAPAADVDVVLDYLWGPPAELAMRALLTRRADRSRAMSWIHIGAVAGISIELPSQLLRSANFTLLGSGQGSVSTAGYLAEFPALLDVLATGVLAVNARVVALADVQAAWIERSSSTDRIELVP